MLSAGSKLTELVKRLHEAAGENLESVILYGSAARGETANPFADLNVLCTLHKDSIPELARVAPVVAWWCKDQQEPAPLFFTASELRESADVFAVELLDMQKNRRILHGTDVLSGIHVPMNLHRVQVEHDLRTMILKLRQHFLRVGTNEPELKSVMAKSLSSAIALLRHVLIAFGEEAPVEPCEVFVRVQQLTGAAAEPFERALEMRDSGAHVDELARLYGQYVQSLSAAVAALDKVAPKKEWRRAKSSS